MKDQYGKPSGKAKPAQYPYGQSGGTEMIGNKMSPKMSREWNKGPGKRQAGRTKGK